VLTGNTLSRDDAALFAVLITVSRDWPGFGFENVAGPACLANGPVVSTEHWNLK
jgi:hypothetical protein